MVKSHRACGKTARDRARAACLAFRAPHLPGTLPVAGKIHDGTLAQHVNRSAGALAERRLFYVVTHKLRQSGYLIVGRPKCCGVLGGWLFDLSFTFLSLASPVL